MQNNQNYITVQMYMDQSMSTDFIKHEHDFEHLYFEKRNK